MKEILVDEVLNIQISSLYNGEVYPKKDGVYLVDDGASYNLMFVNFDRQTNVNAVSGFIIPRNIVVKEHEPQVDLLSKQLDEISDQFDMFNKVLDGLANNNTNNNSNGFDLKEITKMIAVAQKPELLDKKMS
jgi:hypothetical protein